MISQQQINQARVNASELIEKVEVLQGKITVHLMAHSIPQTIRGASITFIPEFNTQTGYIKWHCKSKKLTQKHLPAMCRN